MSHRARTVLSVASAAALFCGGLAGNSACAQGRASTGARAPSAKSSALPRHAKRSALSAEYRAFLEKGRTPKELIGFTLEHSEWKVIDPLVDAPAGIKAGDRLVFLSQGRSALYVVVGNEPLADAGARMISSHIDTPSPRLLLGNLSKSNQALLSAGAHGGIKGAHWLRRPVAIVGEVVTTDGKVVDVRLGGDEDDFSFYIQERAKGEYKLITASSAPAEGDKDEAVGFVELLNERYGLRADDLRASELFIVPTQPPREVGFDRSLIGSHGQDDRANSYVAWRAIANLNRSPRRTAMTWLVDREESGSFGRTGARSHFLELVYSYLLRAQSGTVSEAMLLEAFAKSQALSADTPACVNPNWPEVHEEKHGPVLGKGPAMFPWTGRRGKQGGSEAHAELRATVMSIFGRAKVPVQTAELGRVDEGGGGTVAQYLAHRGMDVIDIGVCVVGMHSPFELSAIEDFWVATRGFEAFFTDDKE